MIKKVEEIIQFYHKYYTQFYSGNLDFTGYVISSLCDDMKYGDLNVCELKHILYVLLAALLYERENEENKND